MATKAVAGIPIERLAAFGTRAFLAAGLSEADARRAARALVDADVHGVSTHGLKNLRGYVRVLQDGKANLHPRPQVVGGGAAAKVMSGDGGLGHVVAYTGMETALDLARAHGTGMVFMRESHHYGASGYWARLALAHEMAGFAFTNAGHSMAPWGGADALVGNNPPAWAFPGPNGAHVFADMALSVVAGNRLDLSERRGQPIPPGWVFDREGQPSTDPAARSKGGTFVPIGEYKGFVLALMFSLHASLLSGGLFDDAQGTERCHWFMAIDVQQLQPLAQVTDHVETISDRVRSSRRKPGVDRLIVPGDLEREKAEQARRSGVVLDSFIRDGLRDLAASLAIPYDLEP